MGIRVHFECLLPAMIWLFIIPLISAQCEKFNPNSGALTVVEKYCKNEILQRNFQMIIRDPTKNTLYLQNEWWLPGVNKAKLTCPPAKQYSLHAVSQFVNSRNCYLYTKNFFCAVMLPECNANETHFHVYEPCEQMCNDLTRKCRLYAFAGTSANCPYKEKSDFGIFNCNEFPTSYLETSRCRRLREVSTTRRTPTTQFTRPPLLPAPRPTQRPRPTLTPGTIRVPTRTTPTSRTTRSQQTLVTTTSVTRTKPDNSPKKAGDMKYKICIEAPQEPGSYAFLVCEWIRSFVRWRWKTFRNFQRITLGISDDLYDLKKATCEVASRPTCFSPNRRKCLTDLYNCRYCYCEIDQEDTYKTVLEYWSQDSDYWTYKLFYQWLELSIHYPDLSPPPKDSIL